MNRFDTPAWRNYIKRFSESEALDLDESYGANGELFLIWGRMEEESLRHQEMNDEAQY